MSAFDDVDELLRAHRLVTGGARGAPPRLVNGARVGASLLRASTALISAALQTEVEGIFRDALPRAFPHFSDAQCKDYWDTCKKWGNPNPANIRSLFFRIGLAEPLNGLSWQKCKNVNVIETLDAINQVRNRIAHGQTLTVNGKQFRLTRPVVQRWRAYAEVFSARFRPHILRQFEQAVTPAAASRSHQRRSTRSNH